MFDADTMRRRFAELQAKRTEIVAAAAPKRAEYESLLAKQQELIAAMRPLLDDLKKIEEPLFSIDQEKAMIVRALKGDTGAR